MGLGFRRLERFCWILLSSFFAGSEDNVIEFPQAYVRMCYSRRLGWSLGSAAVCSTGQPDWVFLVGAS